MGFYVAWDVLIDSVIGIIGMPVTGFQIYNIYKDEINLIKNYLELTLIPYL